MATFAVLKTRVSGVLGLDTTASGVDDVELSAVLNDAVRDFLIRTHANVNRAENTISVATDDTEISTYLAILDIQVAAGSGGFTRQPERTSLAEILRMRQANSSVSGTARYYAFSGSDLISWYPSLAVGDVVMIYYVPRPTEMSSSSHDPGAETYGGIPVEFHPALIEYAKWKMADYDDDSSSQNGLLYQQQYEKLVRDARRWLRGRGGRSMGRVVVGRQPVRKSVPSQDIC